MKTISMINRIFTIGILFALSTTAFANGTPRSQQGQDLCLPGESLKALCITHDPGDIRYALAFCIQNQPSSAVDAVIGHKATKMVSAGTDPLAKLLNPNRIIRFDLIGFDPSRKEFVQNSVYGKSIISIVNGRMLQDGVDSGCGSDLKINF